MLAIETKYPVVAKNANEPSRMNDTNGVIVTKTTTTTVIYPLIFYKKKKKIV